MNIKTEIKEYGFPVTHNCVRSETRITELEAQLAALQSEITKWKQLLDGETAILDWIADNNLLEGFVHVDYDVHEVAIWIAEERDADAEPTVEDYRLGLRHMIRTAIAAEAAKEER